jgi:hypothetical protein
MPGMRTWLMIAMLAVAPVLAQEPGAITGGSAAAHAWRGGAVPFWVRVENKSTVPWTQVSADLVGTDAALGAICWQTPADPGRCALLAPDVAPGDVVLLRGTLTLRESGDWRPQMLVFWRTAANPANTSNVTPVSLGTIEVESYSWSWVLWTSELLAGIGLPLAVLFIGYRVQSRLQSEQDARRGQEKELDENRRRHEKELEEERRAQEKELEHARLVQARELAHAREKEAKQLAERAETLRIMLPKSHRYATRYYATLSLRAQKLHDAVRRYRDPATHETLDDVVFWLVALYHANRIFTRDVGAYYLRDRAGEELVAAAFGALDDEIFKGHREASRALTFVIDLLDQTALVLPEGTFFRLVKGSPEAVAHSGRLAERMKAWIGETRSEATQAYLGVYRRVLDFELNRVYENWYATPERLILGTDEMSAIERLKENRPEYAGEIEKYVTASMAGRTAT